MLYYEPSNTFWSFPMVRKSKADTAKVSREQIVRSVASSSAIETNERISTIEKRLQADDPRFKKLSLAL